MKKIISLLICICLTGGVVAYAEPTSIVTANEYELWTQSPGITCGYTTDEIRIHKAMNKGVLELYQLNDIGNDYYFAICPDKTTKGGYNNDSDTVNYYFYTLYSTDNGFIVLSSASCKNEYMWDRGYSFANISDIVDKEYYKNDNSEIPYYIVSPVGRYRNSNWVQYNEYYFISDKAVFYTMREVIDAGTEGFPYLKDGILYTGQYRYDRGSSYADYYMPNSNIKASYSKPIKFKNKSIKYESGILVPKTEMTGQNGYKIYETGFKSNFSAEPYMWVYGSDDLFFTIKCSSQYDSSDRRDYYYNTVNIYRYDGSVMNFMRSYKIPAKESSEFVYNCYGIENIDADFYKNNSLPIPAVAIDKKAVIMRDGTVAILNFDSDIYKQDYYLGAYRKHLAVVRSRTGDSYIYKTEDGGTYREYFQAINEIYIDQNGVMSLSDDIELKIRSTISSLQDGAFTSVSTWSSPSWKVLGNASVKLWWGKSRSMDNKFPDGRYVEPTWRHIGRNIYEVWYNVYNKDGTLRATGPTGYTASYSSGMDTSEMIAYAVNNSKFLLCQADVGNTFLKEYYRVAVVQENDTGEVNSKMQIGEKNITPPDTSDTEIVQPKIDFGKEELPIGYNIKDNVIDSGKLESELREQVNAIRLNDIVILAENKFQSGSQNTGVILGTFSKYEYSMGSTYIRLYTNGQYFRWYCNSPQKLTPGTYTKEFQVGDKTLYVTFKVIKPPTNDGSTTVVF